MFHESTATEGPVITLPYCWFSGLASFAGGIELGYSAFKSDELVGPSRIRRAPFVCVIGDPYATAAACIAKPRQKAYSVRRMPAGLLLPSRSGIAKKENVARLR